MKLCVCGHTEKEHGVITGERMCYWCDGTGKAYKDCLCDRFNDASLGPDSQPNEHGVYPEEAAECISFAVDKGKAECEIRILQVGEEWLWATDCGFWVGDYSSASGPLSRDREPCLSRSEALLAALDRCLGHFYTGERSGCATPKQVAISRDMHNQLQAFKASIGGADVVAALPVGTQFSLFA